MPGRNRMGPPWWHGRFRGCGYRLTIPREVILDVLSNTSKHLSAEDIYLEVHKSYPVVGLTTVYRTLELLTNMGLISKFDFGDGKARYELSIGPKGTRHHHHLVCSGCGRVIDYIDFIDDEKELLGQIEKGLSKKFNFKITNHLIQFYGLCEKCNRDK
ncbi:MAG: transcriptional repressor [Candidatus Omnitrophica bacterium]|nr:transcriptional repressor [Candidatus Omnitrophota bacterium]